MCAIRALLCTILRCHELSTGPPLRTFHTVRVDPPLSSWPASAFTRYWVICFCVVQNHIRAASLRDIHSYAFSMQPAISSEIIGNVRRSSRACGRGSFEGIAVSSQMLVWCCRSFPIPLPRPRHALHVLASARTQIRIYLRNMQKRRVEMKLVV